MTRGWNTSFNSRKGDTFCLLSVLYFRGHPINYFYHILIIELSIYHLDYSSLGAEILLSIQEKGTLFVFCQFYILGDTLLIILSYINYWIIYLSSRLFIIRGWNSSFDSREGDTFCLLSVLYFRGRPGPPRPCRCPPCSHECIITCLYISSVWSLSLSLTLSLSLSLYIYIYIYIYMYTRILYRYIHIMLIVVFSSVISFSCFRLLPWLLFQWEVGGIRMETSSNRGYGMVIYIYGMASFMNQSFCSKLNNGPTPFTPTPFGLSV